MKMKPGHNASLQHPKPHTAQVGPGGRWLYPRSRQVDEIRSRWRGVLRRHSNKSQLNSCIGALDRFVAQAILRFMSTREVPKNSSVMIRISPEMRKAIDDFRGQLRPIPTAAQVVRDAIQQYLKRQQQAAKQKTG